MNKGFTLAELLGVIVVLALISLVSVPAVSDVLKKNKVRLCETQLENIKIAAKNYGADHFYDLPVDDGDSLVISLKDLTSNGYIDGNIKNPVTKEIFVEEDVLITIMKDTKKFNYTLDMETTNSCK